MGIVIYDKRLTDRSPVIDLQDQVCGKCIHFPNNQVPTPVPVLRPCLSSGIFRYSNDEGCEYWRAV